MPRVKKEEAATERRTAPKYNVVSAADKKENAAE